MPMRQSPACFEGAHYRLCPKIALGARLIRQEPSLPSKCSFDPMKRYRRQQESLRRPLTPGPRAGAGLFWAADRFFGQRGILR